MKNLTKLMAVLFALSLLAPLAFATTETDPATGSAEAKIIAPLELEHATGALKFGTLVSPSAAATVTIPAVSGTPTPVDTNIQRVAGTVSADHFTVTNPEGVVYSINLPANNTVTISDGTHTMAVNDFTHNCPGSCNATDFYVGATLSVAQNQDAGEYEGEYSVSLTY